MKYIPLNHGKVTIVDDEDYDEMIKYPWKHFSVGNLHYVRRYVVDSETNKLKWILMHKQLLDSKTVKVDHKNGNGLDNRKANLRCCTNSQSAANAKKKKNSFSNDLKGVSIFKIGTWVYYKCQTLKTMVFNDPVVCAYFYDVASIIKYKEFASNNNLNPPKRLIEYVKKNIYNLKPHSKLSKKFKKRFIEILKEEGRI